MQLLIPDMVTCVVIHTTASPYGNVESITRWHKQFGFTTIGYHFVILSCYTTYNRWHFKQPDPWSDGKSIPGRQLMYQGAHVRGHNDYTVGIALVGREGQFSSAQLKAAVSLCLDMKHRFPNIVDIKGHYEFPTTKTCPDLDMDQFRFWVDGGGGW